MEKEEIFLPESENGNLSTYFYMVCTNLGILGIVYGAIVSYGLSFYNQF